MQLNLVKIKIIKLVNIKKFIITTSEYCETNKKKNDIIKRFITWIFILLFYFLFKKLFKFFNLL